MLLASSLSLTSTPLRVACVGDSITAGYKASNASMAYPGRLQDILDAWRPGKYAVTNLGAGGATLLRLLPVEHRLAHLDREEERQEVADAEACLLYTSPSPRDA